MPDANSLHTNAAIIENVVTLGLHFVFLKHTEIERRPRAVQFVNRSPILYSLGNEKQITRPGFENEKEPLNDSTPNTEW